jgi:hypothetical protein
MKIKIKDALNLVEAITEKIIVTEKFVIDNSIVPVNSTEDYVKNTKSLLSDALVKLNALYVEKYSLLSVINNKLAEAGVKTDTTERSYSTVKLDLERINSRLNFLRRYLDAASFDGISYGHRVNYVSAASTVGILNDIYNLSNIKATLNKQIEDVMHAVDIDVEVETEINKEEAPSEPVKDAS